MNWYGQNTNELWQYPTSRRGTIAISNAVPNELVRNIQMICALSLPPSDEGGGFLPLAKRQRERGVPSERSFTQWRWNETQVAVSSKTDD
ncbi:MAG: hypothetical protein IJ995_03295 [Clostridia bacterium]|nr:hypothetical protein [Clostridia bacterium]